MRARDGEAEAELLRMDDGPQHNETYARLPGGSEGSDWSSREHFVGVTARARSSVLVDDEKRSAKRSAKRDGELAPGRTPKG